MPQMLARCLGGHELAERVWSVRHYGVSLQEIVCRRELIHEANQGLHFQGNRLVRRATVPVSTVPAFARYAMFMHRNDGPRLCADCRKQVKDLVLEWFCRSC